MKFGDLIGLFKENKKVSKSHMRNLFEMAMVDNHFDDAEFELLQKLAKKHKVSSSELRKIQEDPAKIKFELPDNSDARFEQFYELVKMMTIDGRMFDEEIILCKLFAKKFNYLNGEELIDIIAQNISNGQDCYETKKRVEMYKTI